MVNFDWFLSSAIHLALLEVGVGSGDLVICSTFTYAASAFPIIYCGAIPVFVDSEAQTWGMDPKSLEMTIEKCVDDGKRISAIIAVHIYGMPCDIEQIVSIAGKYGIPLIEDAAEAAGAPWSRGRIPVWNN